MANYTNQYSGNYNEAMKRILGIADKKQEWTDAYNADLNAAIKNGPKLSGQVQPFISYSPGAQKAQTEAKGYYDWLRQNGMEQIAGNLERMDADQARDYAKKLQGTLGNTQIRPYMYSLGEQYGLSRDDVDKLIAYNENTGEVSFGGQNLGTPISEADGRTYWDTGKLDKAFDEYAQRAKLEIPLDKQYNRMAQDQGKMYNDLYWNRIFANPYATDEGKSIMADYGVYGRQAGDNARASRAASNGGNLDSFGMQAANLANAAWVAKGHEAVRAAKNADLDRAIQTLSNMGVDMSRVNDAFIGQGDARQRWMTEEQNREIAKGDADKRWARADVDTKNAELDAKSTRTGLISYGDIENPYLNSDGTIKDSVYKDANTDFAGLSDVAQRNIDNINTMLNTGKADDGHELTTSERLNLISERNRLYVAQNQFADARDAKLARMQQEMPDVDLSGYMQHYMPRPALDNAAMRTNNTNTAAAAGMNTENNNSAENVAGIQAETEKYNIDVQADQADKDRAAALEASKSVGGVGSVSGSNKKTQTEQSTDQKIKAVNDKLTNKLKEYKDKGLVKKAGNSYSVADGKKYEIVKTVAEDTGLDNTLKDAILNLLDITQADIDAIKAMNDLANPSLIPNLS